MIAQMEYSGRSGIVNSLRAGHVFFAVNLKRDPTFFRGKLADPIVLREALAALYHVVVSDYKYHPKDRLAFFAWLEAQDRKFLANLGIRNEKAASKILQLEDRLEDLNDVRDERLKPFYKARAQYFEYVYENQYELNYLLDPIITVHPDEVSFEAFSRDESTYARLAAKFDLFEDVGDFQCGTTNIDFSAGLHNEMEKLRSYRQTQFDVAPTGLTVTVDDQSTMEKKIELPDSWVMGFLQVHSTMTLGMTRFHMAPVDLYNICRFLRRKKTKKSPRTLRYELVPGQPIRAILEPWEHVIELTPATTMEGGAPLTRELTPGAIYDGPKPTSIRTWGRNRLLTITRLLPLCRRVDVFLAGYGLPTIYVLDLGPITFTLALSGWTDNDWTGGGTKFDLLTRQLKVDTVELALTYQALKTQFAATEGELSNATALGVEKTRSALSHLCQIGRAMYDLGGGVFRHRELFPTPFTTAEATKALKSITPDPTPQETAANTIFLQRGIRITSRRPVSTGYKLTGNAKGNDGVRSRPLIHIDHEGHIVEAECTCQQYKKHKLTKGPCEHVLALRLAHMARVEQEDN
ncbi:MAG: SWIM zinc finger family protein [Gemmataceae bacterium]